MARVIQFGNMTGYIPPNGVQVSGDGTATYRVQLDRGQGEAFLAAATADPYKEYDGFGGYIQPSKCSVESGHFDTVTLVFAARDPAMPHLEPGERVKTTYTVASAMYEKPLSDHPNYRMFWDNGLWQWIPKGGEPPNMSPVWAIEATTSEEATGEVYLWSPTLPASKNGDGAWVRILAPDKPGKTTYLYPGVIVYKREYFRSSSGMEAALRRRAVREAPGKYAHLAADWLVTDCSPEFDKDYFICTTEYTGADRWDPDIYPEGGK